MINEIHNDAPAIVDFTKTRKKIFIGTPAYDGKVHVQYAMMLMDLNKGLELAGYETIIRIPTSGSLLVSDRNRLVQMFWESGAEYMICLDSDLGFDPRHLLRMIESGYEFMAGVYPARDRSGFMFRPIVDETGRIKIDEKTKFLGMNYVPAGAIVLKRSLIEKMRKKFPELYYKPKDPRNKSEAAFCFFDTQVYEGEFWGEDYVFCRRAREAGGEIWVDPTITFDHAGIVGCLMEALTDDPKKAQKAA